MIASHVMFVALLIEEVDTVSVDIRMLCASFTYAVLLVIPFYLLSKRTRCIIHKETRTKARPYTNQLAGFRGYVAHQNYVIGK